MSLSFANRAFTSAVGRLRVRVQVLVVFVAILLGPLSTAWAGPAAPDALPVAVVSVKSDDALDQAEALTQALRKAVRSAPGWSLSATNQSLEFLAIELKCAEPIDAACETRIAEAIKADRFVYAIVQFSDKTGKTVVGTVSFFVRGEGTKHAQLSYSANLTDPNDDALIKVAADAFEAVTGGAPKGTVKIRAGGIAGQLFVDDQPMGALPAEGSSYALPAGEHRIVVKSPGYLDAETTVKVAPLATVDTSLTMVEAEDDGPGIDAKIPLGIALVAVGVAGGGGGLYGVAETNAVVQDKAFTDERNLTTPPDGNFCDSPTLTQTFKDQCDRATRGELMQLGGFVGGAVVGTVGLALLFTSDLAGSDEAEADAGPSALQITPIVTPGYQGAHLSYSF